MPRQSNTKEIILDVALELFAIKGYDRVKMVDIANGVGCAPGALYKHYESKEVVYDAMIARSIEGFKHSMKDAQADYRQKQKLEEDFASMTVEDLIALGNKRLDVAIHYKYAKLFRMLMTVEQYQRPQLAELYNQRYIDIQYEDTRVMMEHLIENGILKAGDPYDMGVMFIAPINVMIGLVDRTPDREEWAREQLERHVREFWRVYKA